MLIELTTDRVGPCCTDSAGDVIDVPEDEGRRMIATGQGIAADRAVETASVRPVAERRVTRHPARR